MICLGVGLFGFILIGTSVLPELVWLLLHQVRELSAFISSQFLLPLTHSFLHLIPLWCSCYAWCSPRGLLDFPHFKKIIFSFWCSVWVLTVILSCRSLIWISASSNLLWFVPVYSLYQILYSAFLTGYFSWFNVLFNAYYLFIFFLCLSTILYLSTHTPPTAIIFTL